MPRGKGSISVAGVAPSTAAVALSELGLEPEPEEQPARTRADAVAALTAAQTCLFMLGNSSK
ncbi:hypothetical protein MTOK_30980 [Mycolicibacterium tokaiense]|nr:hypothetical protein MTOK_30980 [Mycolicibacterium tokaiense]